MKFGKYIELWQLECRAEVSDGWKISQDQMIRDYILPAIGDLPIKAVKPIDILRCLNRMKDMGRGSQLRIHVFNILNSSFKSAITLYELIKTNPVHPEFKPKLVTAETIFLVPEHGFMLLAHVIGAKYELAIFINLLCAMRVGEIQGLMWEDSVDYPNAEFIVRRHWCRKTKTMVPRTKNGSDLRVPIPPLMMSCLERHTKPSGYMAGLRGKRMCQIEFHKAIKRSCAELKIPLVSSHGLRHSSTEIWYENGAQLSDIARLLNHKTEKSTARYIHRSSARLKGISAKITSFKKSG